MTFVQAAIPTAFVLYLCPGCAHRAGPDTEVPRTSPTVIESIVIRGTKKVRGATIRRELGVSEGDIVTRGSIVDSRTRLVELGYFDRVTITTRPGSRPGQVAMIVEVNELPVGIFTIRSIWSTTPLDWDELEG
jgi:outer membrane protein insertion porin family